MSVDKNRWKSSVTAKYNIGYHIIWCPKYRRDVLKDGVDLRLKELLKNKAKEIDCQIDIQEIMTDHVNIFVKSPPVLAPHYIVQQLKGYTSRILRKEFKQLRTRIPTLWTRSYYCESIGHISEKTVQKYIEDQNRV